MYIKNINKSMNLINIPKWFKDQFEPPFNKKYIEYILQDICGVQIFNDTQSEYIFYNSKTPLCLASKAKAKSKNDNETYSEHVYIFREYYNDLALDYDLILPLPLKMSLITNKALKRKLYPELESDRTHCIVEYPLGGDKFIIYKSHIDGNARNVDDFKMYNKKNLERTTSHSNSGADSGADFFLDKGINVLYDIYSQRLIYLDLDVFLKSQYMGFEVTQSLIRFFSHLKLFSNLNEDVKTVYGENPLNLYLNKINEYNRELTRAWLNEVRIMEDENSKKIKYKLQPKNLEKEPFTIKLNN